MNAIWRRIPIYVKLYPIISNLPKTIFTYSRSFTNIGIKNVLKDGNLRPINCTYNIIRTKSKKKQWDPDSDDETDINDDDFSLTKDSKLVKFHTTSLRTDLILKSTLGIARNKVEELFYESKIRVNGKKILKKSLPVKIDYEIDVIKSISPKNPNHLYVARVIILNLAAKEETIAITARRFRNLLIENYEEDPYQSSTTEDGDKIEK